MGKKFGIPVRHSDRWEQAIDKAAKAMLKPIRAPKIPKLTEDLAPVRVRRARKPVA